jgi:peptide/nickel transport system substrate-binding protein
MSRSKPREAGALIIMTWPRALAGALFFLISFSCDSCSPIATPQEHDLRIADASEPSSLNPLLAHDQDAIGLDLLFVQTLVGLSRDNRLIPILITRVPSLANGDISPNGRTIVYHLRPRVRFADGQPLTSSDVAFTFHAIMDPRNPVQNEDAYRRVASLTTPDSHTVVVRLRQPWNAAIRELFAESDYAFGILPAHAFTSTGVQGAAWEDHAYGSGPFRVTEWRRGDRIILEPNPYFSPRPKLARIELRMIPDLNAVVVALRSGEADLARVTAAQVPALNSISSLRIVKTPINGMDYLSIQTAAPPTNDVRVRRAIADVLDIPLIERAFHRLSPPAAAFLPPVLPWHDWSLAPIARNDLAAASLLDSAGWHLQKGVRTKQGSPLEVLLVSQAGFTSGFASIVQRQLASVGILGTIKMFPASTFNGPQGPLRTGQFNIAAQGWIGSGDPEGSVVFACDQIGPNGTNITRFCDREFEAAFADQATTPRERQRAADFIKMQRIVYYRLPIIPLNYRTYFDALSPRVTGFARNMLGFPVNAEAWDVR